MLKKGSAKFNTGNIFYKTYEDNMGKFSMTMIFICSGKSLNTSTITSEDYDSLFLYKRRNHSEISTNNILSQKPQVSQKIHRRKKKTIKSSLK